jgi:PleD family two-component response regulator
MSEPLSRSPVVLIANAHEWSARSLDSILVPKGYSVVRALTDGEALERARLVQPDLVILDVGLPETGGIELCRALRAESSISSAMPILLTSSGPITRDVRVAALRAGAWECVSFPLDAEVLLLKVDTFCEAKARSEAAVQEPSLVDPVTGFYTEQGLLGRVRDLAAESARLGRPLSCVAIGPA